MKFLSPLTLIALALIAGCNKASHAEGDGHDHGPGETTSTVKTDDHGHGEGEDHSDEAITLSKAQEAIASIETKRVSMRLVQPSIKVPGVISTIASERAVVTPPVSGRVVSLSVQLGQQVQRGQVLAVIESTELAEAWARITEASRSRDEAEARVRESINQVKLAEAKLHSTRQTLSRQKEFAAAGAFNAAPLQQAQNDLNDAQGELLSAKNELATHSEQLRRTENLFRDGLVSKHDLDEAVLDVQKDTILLNRATQKVEAAKVTLEREKRIAERGLLNSREIQTAEAEVRSATIELERTRGSLRSSRDLLSSASRAVDNAQSTYKTFTGGATATGGRVSLVSPITGTVTKFDVTRGQAVDRTQNLLEVENLDAVWATAQVPERDSADLRKGMLVSVRTASLPDLSFEGTVQVVSSRIDPKTRTLALLCRLQNSEQKLKPEMFVEVEISKGKAEQVLAVPTTAVVRDNGKSYVFVKGDKGYKRHEVTLGSVSMGFSEVLSGVESGEEVAVKGAFTLMSQQKKDELKGHEH